MEAWASKQDTIEALASIGFGNPYESNGSIYMDSRGQDEFGCILQVRIYQCKNNYYCVDADNGWFAPVIWKGEKADYDHNDPLKDFEAFLDNHFPGWR